jgi:chorismate mutase
MIDELRARIDVIDEQLVALLNTRAACAIEIGRLKRSLGLPIYQPEREAEVVRRVREATAHLGGPLTEEAMGRLFERIIDEARRLEGAASRESAPAARQEQPGSSADTE